MRSTNLSNTIDFATANAGQICHPNILRSSLWKYILVYDSLPHA